MPDEPKTTEIVWRVIDTAPQGRCLKVLVAGWSEWTYATFERGAWRDANDTPIDAVAWSPVCGEDNE